MRSMINANAYQGTHKPYLPAGCQFYMLQGATKEYHVDWSHRELDFILDRGHATNDKRELVGMDSRPRNGALRHAS